MGYNFSSGAQQPFLQVADNMKRLSNYMDGFSQQLIFKGYANEGHDSGHSDFQDVNRRAGGEEDMRIAVAEAEKINSNLGIHINEHEIYPEAKMFNDHTATGQNGWYWMDQSRILRRYVDMLDTTMENYFEQRMDALFEKVPIKFVYVDCWGEDRWGEKELIGTMLENGVEIFGNENAADDDEGAPAYLTGLRNCVSNCAYAVSLISLIIMIVAIVTLTHYEVAVFIVFAILAIALFLFAYLVRRSAIKRWGSAEELAALSKNGKKIQKMLSVCAHSHRSLNRLYGAVYGVAPRNK